MSLLEEVDAMPPCSPIGAFHFETLRNRDYHSYKSRTGQSKVEKKKNHCSIEFQNPSEITEKCANLLQHLPVKVKDGIDGDTNNRHHHHNVNRGSFPSLYPEDEEEWRNDEQHLENLLSSSSQSTSEDLIFTRTSTDDSTSDSATNHDGMRKMTTYPIDSDDEISDANSNKKQSNDDKDVEMLLTSPRSSSSKRPDPDDATICRSVTIHQAQYKSQSSPLRNKEPEFYLINNSAENEELDAMIAAIDSSGSDVKVPQMQLPTTTKRSTSRSMKTRRSHGNSRSPTLQLDSSHGSATILASPSFDSSSAVIGSMIAAAATTIDGHCGHATNHSRSVVASATEIRLPETAPGRRKTHRQNRERSRGLSSTYRKTSSILPMSELSTSSNPDVFQPNATAGVDVVNISLNPSHKIGKNVNSKMAYVKENNTSIGCADLPSMRTLYGSTSNANVSPGKTAVLRLVGDTSFSDRLSDIPCEVDPLIRGQYLKACRILKSSLLEKDTKIHPHDKEFLSKLLLEATPSEGEDNNNYIMTDDKLKVYESSVCNALFEPSSPLFNAAITIVKTTNDLSHATGDTTSNDLESNGVTEQEQQIKNYAMNDHYATMDSFRSKQRQINKSTPIYSQESAAAIRVDDNYPYTAMGLNVGGHNSKVLLPWMMDALRSYLPLEISNYNFRLKYHLDRNSDCNYESNANLMKLLSKVRDDTYTIICVGTVDGYVFGALCSSPWQLLSCWYGSGDASFLWRLKQPRHERSTNEPTLKNDEGRMNEIEVFPFTRYDSYVQYCSNQILAVGGGTDLTLTKEGCIPTRIPPPDSAAQPPHNELLTTAGIGFLLDGDLMGGETNSCATYMNPRLGYMNGTNEFDIQTLEVYTLTKFAAKKESETNG